MHEYSLARRTHAFFDSVLLVSVKREESRVCAVYRHCLYYNFINIMTTGAVFHYLIPFSAHLIAFPSTLFDFMSITKVICFLFVL
uniref:Uncharacterized protein n=1 Tax=Myoviridae sp. ctUPB15 TaxID=2825116 RepID=A0A8S5PVY2_9CAUD|nr:MAG TPA: hypothetical protein [Myoviridae sp. ctUPB15]